MDGRPVGIFDSGMGGVSLLRDALKVLPNENYIYYGDNLNAPYGDRSEDEILELTSKAADFLLEHGVKALVLACNTATSAAINILRQKLDVPVVSVEPAIKPACEKQGNGKVFMLATDATTKLSRYRKLLSRMPDPSRVVNVGISGIVSRVERGELGIHAYDDIFDKYLAPYHGETADAVVLGCTHYVFIHGAVKAYFKNNMRGECAVYDGNRATARQLRRVLEREDLLNPTGEGRADFFTSGDQATLRPIFDMLICTPITE